MHKLEQIRRFINKNNLFVSESHKLYLFNFHNERNDLVIA